MACLSHVINDGDRELVAVAANPIFLLSSPAPGNLKPGTEFAFELLEDDAEVLYSLIGQNVRYYLEENLFWATLRGLEPCASTQPVLDPLRDRPMLRGVLIVTVGDAADGG